MLLGPTEETKKQKKLNKKQTNETEWLKLNFFKLYNPI